MINSMLDNVKIIIIMRNPVPNIPTPLEEMGWKKESKSGI